MKKWVQDLILGGILLLFSVVSLLLSSVILLFMVSSSLKSPDRMESRRFRAAIL